MYTILERGWVESRQRTDSLPVDTFRRVLSSGWRIRTLVVEIRRSGIAVRMS